jgi:hypothetical protein
MTHFFSKKAKGNKDKKVRGGCSLLGPDIQKPYTSGQGKTIIDLFRDFFTKIVHVQVTNFIPVKMSTLYIRTLDTNKIKIIAHPLG